MYWRNNGSIVNVNIIHRGFKTSESCIKLHAVVVLEHFLSEHLSRCVCTWMGPNAENNISLLVILCIIM